MNHNPNNNSNSMNTFPNGRYGPFGYNDNNQNRHKVPSNTYPPHGGMKGNEMGRFNPLTTNTQQLLQTLPSMSNFQKAYNQNVPLIEPYNYTNQNELLHNNIGEIVLDEHIVEYRINIDSIDRDISIYNDPFNFTVKFNPPAKSIIRTEVLIDPCNRSKGTRIEESLMEGPPRPHINREFKNVKYIKLDSIILPQHHGIVKGTNGYEFDKDKFLVDDRFIVLRIKELDDDRDVLVSSVHLSAKGNELVADAFVEKLLEHICPEDLNQPG